jgi:hypothetical protein
VEGLGRGADGVTRPKVKLFDKITIVLALGMVVALIGLYPLTTRTNCGGNSAALVVCQNCGAVLLMAGDGKGEKFNINKLSASDSAQIAQFANSHWILGSKIFLRTNIVLNSNPKQILIVCDHAYDNVPQPTIWNGYRKNRAHAVAYSDGSTGLLTPKQFKELDLSRFVDASQLKTNASATIP